MSRLFEYIKRYEGIHTGKDGFLLPNSDKVLRQSDTKELFSGVQFLRKFPSHLKRICEEKGRAITLLDYGCGKGYMPWRPYEQYKNGIWGHLPSQIQSIYLYDPCYPPFSARPPLGWQFDVVGCADVMEHVPEEDVETVLADIASFCKEDGVIMFSISGNKAFKSFEDGENLHCTVHPIDWWKNKIEAITKRSYVLIHSEETRVPPVNTIIGKRR